jgi:hypothetical protein
VAPLRKFVFESRKILAMGSGGGFLDKIAHVEKSNRLFCSELNWKLCVLVLALSASCYFKYYMINVSQA